MITFEGIPPKLKLTVTRSSKVPNIVNTKMVDDNFLSNFLVDEGDGSGGSIPTPVSTTQPESASKSEFKSQPTDPESCTSLSTFDKDSGSFILTYRAKLGGKNLNIICTKVRI